MAFRRRREGKTNYHRRRKILRGRLPLLVVRVSNRNITAQVIKPQLKGDITLAHTHSRELLRYGWWGSRKSIPAAYLVGYSLGLKALKAGVEEAILYVGVERFTPRGRVTGVVKGALDAGLKVRVDPDQLPDEGRLMGTHIASYAEALRRKGALQSRFGGILRAGGDPAAYPRMVETVRGRIREVLG
jgi:large subunit ribosomal protein L18